MAVDCRYGIGREVEFSFDDAVNRVESLVVKHGFGVFSRINLADVFGPDENLPFSRYLIIGACRPDFAKHAFSADPNIGLLLPCNIIVVEDLKGKVRVLAKDPLHVMDLLSVPVAIEATMLLKDQLEQIIDEI